MKTQTPIISDVKLRQRARRYAMARGGLAVLGASASLACGFALSGCGALGPREKVKVTVIGLEPLSFHALELRFALKLRILNPNDVALSYDGLEFELAVNGKPLATGLTDAKGSVPRYGEAVITVPVSVSALEAVRQIRALSRADAKETALPYVLRGKLGAGWLGQIAFEHSGSLALPR
jgi:LEA14-like dessication related protein